MDVIECRGKTMTIDIKDLRAKQQGELKPCPFCGGEAKMRYWRKQDSEFMQWGNIYCIDDCCAANGTAWSDIRCDTRKETHNEALAIKRWNARYALPELLDMVEGLESKLIDLKKDYRCLKAVERYNSNALRQERRTVKQLRSSREKRKAANTELQEYVTRAEEVFRLIRSIVNGTGEYQFRQVSEQPHE